MELRNNIVAWGLLFVMGSIPGSIYHYYNRYLFSDNGLIVTVKEAVADAVAQSGRNDLEISDITGLSCLDRTQNSKSNIRIYDCAAMARLADGRSTPICITRTKKYRYSKKRSYSIPKRVNYLTDVTVSLCGIDSSITSSRQISRKWLFR